MSTGEPRSVRVVFLGASNLTLALPDALRHAARRFAGRDLTFFVAHGPGRSYGVEAGVGGIRFTGILKCGAVEALERERETFGPATTVALLTDVGNDILYESGTEQVLGWVGEIAGRLLAQGARVGITSLPLESVETLPLWKFHLLRPIFYPFRNLTRREVLAQAREIQQGLERLGRERGIRILAGRRIWYGFDCFHLSRRCRAAAFAFWLDEVLAGVEGVSPEAGGTPRWPWQVSRIGIRLHRPCELVVFGRRRVRPPDWLALGPGARLHCF